MTIPTIQLLHGDAITQLRTLPSGAARCCVTSPPYWGLRDYGVEGQIGMEATPELYVELIVAVFREVWRVLADDGTLWVNLGDSYASKPNGTIGASTLDGSRHSQSEYRRTNALRKHSTPGGCKHKDLIGLPWMVAFALRADGWYLRSDIIWAKPNPMPESVTDRPTKAHEYIFLLSKHERYYYDAEAIREPSTCAGAYPTPAGWDTNEGAHGQYHRLGRRAATDKQRGHSRRHAGFNARWDAMSKAEQGAHGRNKRSWWQVATQPYPEAHFATFPEALVQPCILAGSAPGDTVLDPFAGSGTTGAVAYRLGRSFIGIDLNDNYLAMARRRIHKETPALPFAPEGA